MSTATDNRHWVSSYGSVPAELPTTTGSILDSFREVLTRDPETVMMRYFDTPITAAEIDEISDALAVALQERGILAGDRIAMYLQNVPHAMISLLSAWKVGGVIVPCNPMLKGAELVKILSDSGSRAIILHDDLYANIAQAVLDSTAVEFAVTASGLDFLAEGETHPNLKGVGHLRFEATEDFMDLVEQYRGQTPETVELTSDDVAFMVYTSGTTGAPKGAMSTHGNGFFAASAYQHWMQIGPETVILGLAPLFHVTGLTGHLVLSMISGAELLIFYRFDADVACRLTERYRASFAVTAITAFTALLSSEAITKFDMSSLTKVYSGGAPIPTTVIEQWRGAVGSTIHPMYGLTEVTSPATMTPLGADYRSDPNLGVVSIGVPIPNTHIRIVNDQGVESAPREVGELRISGPQVVPGYWQLPEDTAETFEGGELRTGDIGFMDEDGWVYLVDRSKDMIVASGFKVWPSEVEEVLHQHPAIREAGVIGVPDTYRGETVKAYVSLKAGAQATADEIKAFARERMAAYKYPRYVEIIDDLPKTTSGKILRRMLQDLVESTLPTPGAEADSAMDDFPKVQAAIEARTVLEIGSAWLRLSQGGISPREAADLYARLGDLLGTVTDANKIPDLPAFLDKNERYHEAIIDLMGNPHISKGFRKLRMKKVLGKALKKADGLADDFAETQEQLTDAIAAGNIEGARQAIMLRAASSRANIRAALNPSEPEARSTRWSHASLLQDDDAGLKPVRDLVSDVTELLEALEARAALEIGITQVLASAETTLPERSRFVARLKAAIPLVRGTDSAHAARYTRADDTFHRIIVGLLENERLIELYNRIDPSETLFRVLEVAPVTVRDALDNYQALTAALLDDEGDGACRAIASHMMEVRAALTKVVASHR